VAFAFGAPNDVSPAVEERGEIFVRRAGVDQYPSEGTAGSGQIGQCLHQSTGRSPEISGALAKVIEAEIIPRLLLSHRDLFNPTKQDKARSGANAIGDIDAFANLLLNGEQAEVMDAIRTMIERDVNLSQIYLNFLAPAARRLEEFWEMNLCAFPDLSRGFSRLTDILREIGELRRG
jgi:hypothetical protein